MHLPLPVWDYIFQQQVHGQHRSPEKSLNQYRIKRSFDYKNWSLLYPKMRWDKVELANWFWRRKVLNFIKCIFAISILSFLEKRQILHLNELESYFILTRGYFLSSLAEIGPVVLDFGLFFYLYLSLEKGMNLFWRNQIPFTQGYFVLCLVEID